MIQLAYLPADALGLSAIAMDALSGRLALRDFVIPRRIEDLPVPSERFEPREREALARVLEQRLAPLAPNVAVLDAVRALARPGTLAVITGQQPGLFASPLYSIYKALQAVRLARALHVAWERPVVALFWNHADDHDVAEVHHAHLLNENLDVRKVGLAGLSSGRMPLSAIAFDEERHHLTEVRALVAELCHDEPHAARAIELFMPRHGETFATAFTRSMTDLLGPLGLVMLEPDWIRAELSAALARFVATDLAGALAAGGARLRELGHDAAIEPGTAAVLFRHVKKSPERAPERLALRFGGDGFQFDGEAGSRTPTELAAQIVQEPLAWSPGALLRPIVQDACLPAVAYVGGMGELAYHAQLGPLRAALGVPSTPFVPRISCTLLDPEARVALRKLEVTAGDVVRARGKFAAERDDAGAPPVLARLRGAGAQSARALTELASELGEFDGSLVPQLKRTADQVRDLVERLAEKAERVHQNRSGKGRRHERRVNNALFPMGEPQERILGPIQFVARFGVDWIAELGAELAPLSFEHVLVSLGAEMEDSV
ncbi:MAG: bacillithiol biosynthesis cysteine-adding enzyme BshC [Planctomycetota bacterium]